MELLRKTCKALCRAGKNNFRCVEVLARRECPRKRVGMNAHHQAHLLHLVFFYLRLEAAAVHQRRANANAALLGAVRLTQKHSGVLLVAGSAASAAAFLNTVCNGQALHLALHGVSAVEVHPVPISIGQVKAHAVNTVEHYFLIAAVFYTHAAGDDILFCQYTVKQHHAKLAGNVFQHNFQRLRVFLVGINSGQAFNRVFAFHDTRTFKAQIQRRAAVRVSHGDSGNAEIRHTACCIFQRQRIQRISTAVACLGDIAGKTNVGIVQPIVHAAAGFCAIPQVVQNAVFIHLHLIEGVGRFQRKYLVFHFNRHV